MSYDPNRVLDLRFFGFNAAGDMVRIFRLVALKLDQIKGKNSGKKKSLSRA